MYLYICKNKTKRFTSASLTRNNCNNLHVKHWSANITADTVQQIFVQIQKKAVITCSAVISMFQTCTHTCKATNVGGFQQSYTA